MIHLPSRPRRLRDLPLKTKLLAITLVVAALISAVAFAGFRIVANGSNTMIYTQTANSLGFLSDKIASRLDAITDVSLLIAVNRDVQTNLDTIAQQDRTAAWGSARSAISDFLYRSFHNDIVSIAVLPPADNAIIWGTDSSPETDAVLARAALLAEEAKGGAAWCPTGRDDGSVLCVRQIRNITRPFLEPMGLLVIRVNLDKIVRESAQSVLTLPEYTIGIRQNNGEALYPPDLPSERALAEAGNEDAYRIERIDGEMRFLVYSSIKATRLDWRLTLGISYDEMFRALLTANIAYTAAVLGAVVLAMFLSRLMFGGINRNIQLLKSKMDRVRGGDLEPYPVSHPLPQDELGTLNRYFDEMTADFKKVIDDNYVKELLLTQTQLKALEQQINPHFLYNSLEAVHWFARRGDGEQISVIAQSLGSLLRNTLSEDEDRIPLSRELAILESYLRIQRIRFPDTLLVRLEIQPEIQDTLIPKMSIQPLVENAIVHSLEENIGLCRIDVRVTVDGELLRVEVENDGSEIREDILELLRAKKVKAKGNGIGLINIDTRIKLLYGPEYGLRFASAEDRVTVSFAVPAPGQANQTESEGEGEPGQC